VVLRKRKDLAVAACIQIYDALVEFGHIRGIIFCDVVGEIQKDIIFHIHLGCVGMHPEDIRHRTAGCACFEERPVVVPVDDLDLG